MCVCENPSFWGAVDMGVFSKPSHVSSHDWANNSNNIWTWSLRLWKCLFLCDIMIMSVITVTFAERFSTGVFTLGKKKRNTVARHECFVHATVATIFVCLFFEKVHWSSLSWISRYILRVLWYSYSFFFGTSTMILIQEPYVNISVPNTVTCRLSKLHVTAKVIDIFNTRHMYTRYRR